MTVAEVTGFSSQYRYRRRRRKTFSLLGFSLRETFLILIITFPVMGTLFPVDTYFGGSIPALTSLVAKSPLNTTILLSIILVYAFWLFSRDVGKAAAAFARTWPIWIFLVWAFIASNWAANPGYAFNRAGRMLVFALYAVYIVEYLDPKRSLKVMLAAVVLSGLVSMMMIVGLPSLSRSEDARGAWRGAMGHKNGLGSVGAIILMTAMAVWKMRILDTTRTMLVALLALLLIGLANSATALLTAVIVTGFIAFSYFANDRTRYPLVTFLIAIVAVCLPAYAIAQSGIIFELLNRDATLTGRAEVWEFAGRAISLNPFWGYGLGIWQDENFMLYSYYELGWLCPHAHNAWLDFRLQLGLPGFMIACGLWGLATVNALKGLHKRRVTDIALPIGIFLFLSIRSYTETVMTDPALNDMFWFAYAFASFKRNVRSGRISGSFDRRVSAV